MCSEMARQVQTYVFFDIETTGLPWQERNQTKIIEISFVAVNRNDIIKCPPGSMPNNLNKLSLLVNPNKDIHPDVSSMTGILNDDVQNFPVFLYHFNCIYSFLHNLQHPVCLIAHNGNSFDYKILLAECIDAGVHLPTHILCVDSLVGFRKILKGPYKSILRPETGDVDVSSTSDWPELDISLEEWQELDELCLSLSDSSIEDNQGDVKGKSRKKKVSEQQLEKRDKFIGGLFKSKGDGKVKQREAYNLSTLYKRLLNKDAVNAHRAEHDCLMLLECFIVLKNDIISWTDDNCKTLSSIKPLIRY